jgi:transposase-like protein
MSIVNCPKCQSRSQMTRSSPGPKGHVVRAFQCPTCAFVHTDAVPSDPMKAADNWVNSSLKPPD